MNDLRQPTALEPLLTIPQVSASLQVAEKTIRKWVYLNKIPYIKINGSVRFRERDIKAWIAGSVVTSSHVRSVP